MPASHRRVLAVVLIACGFLWPSLLMPSTATAQNPANAEFMRTWARVDDPVAQGEANRTWIWGPEAYSSSMLEEYDESPGSERQVQYFDKARMEINDPDADEDALWFVTNGLLVVELISGRMQVGDDRFLHREPAEVNVAGDWDDPLGPTYATFHRATSGTNYSDGVINVRLGRDGTVYFDSSLRARGIESGRQDPITGHRIADPFQDFMNARGTIRENGRYRTDRLFLDPLFATGRPITRPYWANVKVGGEYQDVLLQCFERRCLTYTPENPEGWRVEAGNVGQHYFAWRYEQPPVDAFWEPHAVAVDDYGTVYVGSGRNNRILRFTDDGKYLGTWGSDGIGLGDLAFPTAIALDGDGTIYVVENENHRVQLFTDSGLPYSVWSGAGGSAGEFLYPYGVAIDSSDNVYVTDHFNHRVQKFGPDGIFVASWGEFGVAEPGAFRYPSGIAVSPDGIVYVADTLNNRIQMFTPDGKYVGEITGGSGIGRFNQPYGLTFHKNGALLIADSQNQRIQMFDSGGMYLESWDLSWVGQFSRPVGVTTDSEGSIYVVDAGEYQVIKLDARGRFQFAFAP